MGFKDLLDFDEAAYIDKMKTKSIEDLHEHECTKYRQEISGSWSVGVGIGLVPLTFGVSLIGSAYGARRYDIAAQKLKIVKAEIDSRKETHYETRKRDMFIPMAIGALTVGVGCGLECLAMDATSTATTAALADHGVRAAKDMVHDPSNFFSGVEHGVSLQGHEMSNVASHGLHQATVLANHDSTAIIAHASGMNASEAAGHASGAALALSAEKEAADTLVSGIPTGSARCHCKT